VRPPVKNLVDQELEPLILLRNAPVLTVAAKNFAKLNAGPVVDTSTKFFAVWKSFRLDLFRESLFRTASHPLSSTARVNVAHAVQILIARDGEEKEHTDAL
jgi:hypothetical protein